MHTPPPAPGTPRWHQLVLLGAAVTGVHLWLLAGEWPGMAHDAVSPAPASLAEPQRPASTATTADLDSTRPPAPVRPVTVSSVRWVIAPPAAEAPAPPQDAPSATAPRPPRTPLPGPDPRPAEEVIAPSGDSAPLLPAGDSPIPAEAVELAQAAPPAEPPAPPASATEAPATPPPRADAPPLPPASAPASAALIYEVAGSVRGISYNAQATLDWTLEAGRYDARMAVRLPLVGSRVQTSAGQVGATGLLPERFADKARSERAAHFDHAQQRIRFSANTPDAELQPGAQDRLSVFLQLAARLNAAPDRIQAGQLIELQVAGPADAEPWRFRLGEEETLNLPAGALRTRQLVREPQQPRDSQVELWLAPDLQHLPVRIRIVQHNGDQLDQQLSRLP